MDRSIGVLKQGRFHLERGRLDVDQDIGDLHQGILDLRRGLRISCGAGARRQRSQGAHAGTLGQSGSPMTSRIAVEIVVL